MSMHLLQSCLDDSTSSRVGIKGIYIRFALIQNQIFFWFVSKRKSGLQANVTEKFIKIISLLKLNSVEIITLNKDDLDQKHHPKDWDFPHHHFVYSKIYLKSPAFPQISK